MKIKPLICFSLLCLLGGAPPEVDADELDSLTQTACALCASSEEEEEEEAVDPKAVEALRKPPDLGPVTKFNFRQYCVRYSPALKSVVVVVHIRKTHKPEIFTHMGGKLEKATDDQRKKLVEEFKKRWRHHDKGGVNGKG